MNYTYQYKIYYKVDLDSDIITIITTPILLFIGVPPASVHIACSNALMLISRPMIGRLEPNLSPDWLSL